MEPERSRPRRAPDRIRERDDPALPSRLICLRQLSTEAERGQAIRERSEPPVSASTGVSREQSQ